MLLLQFGAGLLNRFERGQNKQDIIGKFPTRVSVHIPEYTDCVAVDCGFDTFTQSGKNISCATCHGTGRIAVWHIAHVMTRVSWVDRIRIGIEFWKGVPAGETGEVIMQGMLRDKALFQAVLETDTAYILLNEQHLRPFSITSNRVEGETSVDVRCNIVKQ